MLDPAEIHHFLLQDVKYTKSSVDLLIRNNIFGSIQNNSKLVNKIDSVGNIKRPVTTTANF